MGIAQNTSRAYRGGDDVVDEDDDGDGGGGGSTRSKRDIAGGTSHIIKPRHNGMPLIRTYISTVLAPGFAQWQIPTRLRARIWDTYTRSRG